MEICPTLLCPSDAHDTNRHLSFDDLEILNRELSKEASRVRRDLSILLTSSEANVDKTLRPHRLMQIVKAYCNKLGNIEPIELAEFCETYTDLCRTFHEDRNANEGDSCQAAAATHHAAISQCLANVEKHIQKLIEVYARTFRVNFKFKSKEQQGKTKTRIPQHSVYLLLYLFSELKSISSCTESFLVQVKGVHRIKQNTEWNNFERFSVQVSLLY